MTPLEDLLKSRFKTAFDGYNFEAIDGHVETLVDHALHRDQGDAALKRLLKTTISAILLLQSRIDGFGETAVQNLENDGLRMPRLETLPAQSEASIDIAARTVPAGLDKLEKSASSGSLFRWLTADTPMTTSFRIRHTGRLEFSIDYLSFADGVSVRDLTLRCNGAVVPLTDDPQNKRISGTVDLNEDFHSELVVLKLSSEGYFLSGAANRNRKIVLSITDMRITAAKAAAVQEKLSVAV